MREFQQTPAGVRAAELVTGDRQATYGDPLISLNRIASLWGSLIGVDLTPRQVAHMMILLKVSRDQATPNADNEVDICGYAHLLQMEREDTESQLSGWEDTKQKLDKMSVDQRLDKAIRKDLDG